ncbi:hypothetical protein Bca52824_031348 [Brassica carinata]|uniref:Uncharacterized protein n=1 Tax=Brassica carinata TaxID=52824 RepID=A0A8X7SB30_BRACI|nr:hypothetical protein Bca52824_031348 [Brassica carinata]
MSFTGIQCLPVGFRVENLIHLDLEDTSKLSSIVGICALVNLKVLRLLRSNVWCGPNTLEELQFLEHLEILTIGIIYGLGLDQFFKSHKLMRCTQALAVKSCQLESSNVSLLASMEKVHELLFNGCTFSDIKMDVACNRSKTVPKMHVSRTSHALLYKNVKA